MYEVVSVVVFIVMGIIWTRKDFLNLVIKLGFFGLAVWGLIASNVLTLNL